MSEFERIKTSELLVRDVDMARFFIKYAKENAEYILAKDEENVPITDFHKRMGEIEKELSYYFDLMKMELGVNGERIESKRAKKRRKQKKRRG